MCCSHVCSFDDTWVYDAPGQEGLLAHEQRAQAFISSPPQVTMHKTYAYDAFNRPAGYTVQYDPHFYPEAGQLDSPIFAVAPEYTVAIDYDTYFARPKAVTYPQERLRTYTKYDLNGFVVEEGNSLDYNSAAVFYRQVTGMTATGQVTAETFGNGKVQTYDYHPATFQMTGTEVPGLIDLNYTHDRFGNLVRQAEGVQNSIETFEYDHLHRMTQSSRSVAGTANPNPIDYAYDALGNITKKSDYGSSYSYGAGTAGPNAVTSVTLATGDTTSFGYDANGNMTTGSNTTGSPLTGNFAAHYDAQNKPFRLARGINRSEFWYGSDQQRYYQRDEQGRWTFYVDKLYEQKSSTLHKLYLGDYGVFTVDVTSGQNSGITYLHKDRLGSIVAMTDETGNPVQNADRGFDPFGKPREGNWGDSDNGDEVPFPNQRNGDLNRPDQTTRGFTGHEHLNNVAITHMNGRAYDYNLGRFLSVDPVIQFPANSQSLNPYSYIMNNPLSGTDPTGYSTCTEPTNKECNPPEEEAKPRDKIEPTVKCDACILTTFNGGDSRMSSEDSNEGNKSPDQIGATVNRDNTQSMGEMAGPEGSGCMVPLRCAGGDAVVSFAGTEFANGAVTAAMAFSFGQIARGRGFGQTSSTAGSELSADQRQAIFDSVKEDLIEKELLSADQFIRFDNRFAVADPGETGAIAGGLSRGEQLKFFD